MRIYDLYRRGFERKALEPDRRWIAGPHAFPFVQGSGRAHEGTDQEGKVASLDREGRACARLYFRRRHWATSGSHHRRSAKLDPRNPDGKIISISVAGGS